MPHGLYGSESAGARQVLTSTRLMLPREHGAWAMLALPFVSALLLARRMTWEVVPAAAVVVGIFVIREPVVVLWRRAEAGQARRSLWWYLPGMAGCGIVLLWGLPAWPLLGMGAAAAALTATSVYLTVHNRQRSLVLQMASAAGLTASALVAWLATGAEWDSRIWWLWGLQMAHSAAALLAVHARLEAHIAARARSGEAHMKTRAVVAQGLLASAAAGCAAAGRVGVALPLALSAAVHAADLVRLQDPAFLRTPLRRIGQRELFLSLAFAALVVAGLW